jgi:hypothetical protein
MKTTTTNTLAAKKTTDGSTFTALKTLEQITNEFVAAQRKKEDGSNDHLQDFLHVAQAIIATFENQTFQFQDFVTHSTYLDFPHEELKKYFDAYIKILKQNGRVIETAGCYDHTVFSFQ